MNSKKKEIQNKEKPKENVANVSLNSRIINRTQKKESNRSVSFNLNNKSSSPTKNKKLLLNLRKLNKPKRQKSFQTTQEKMDFMISAYNNQLEMQNGLNYSSDDSLSEGHLFKTFSLKKQKKTNNSFWTKISDLILYKDKVAFHNRIENIKRSIQEKLSKDDIKLYSPKNARRSSLKKRRHDRRHGILGGLKNISLVPQDKARLSPGQTMNILEGKIQESQQKEFSNPLGFSIKLKKNAKVKNKKLTPLKLSLKNLSTQVMAKKYTMADTIKSMMKEKRESDKKKLLSNNSIKINNRLAYSLKSESKNSPTVENFVRKISLKNFRVNSIQKRVTLYSDQMRKQYSSSVNPKKSIVCPSIAPVLSAEKLNSLQKQMDSFTRSVNSNRSFKASLESPSIPHSEYLDFRNYKLSNMSSLNRSLNFRKSWSKRS
ncbi:unnamed protein product [Moneuplotes crassus]|uniref:Uncharacterized protein n=1 Tax=Euplotes crassus TaxID=5936 RepID=A0AAD1UDU8_EUPCR|nr:unnamed protein product [Moneuplotes crassus]